MDPLAEDIYGQNLYKLYNCCCINNFQKLYFNLEMEEVELSYNLTELLNLSGDCGVALSSEAVETINYYRYF